MLPALAAAAAWSAPIVLAGVPVGEAVAALSAMTGEALRAGPEFADERVVLVVKDAEAEAAMRALAWAVRGRWANLADRRELRPDQPAREKEALEAARILGSDIARAFGPFMPPSTVPGAVVRRPQGALADAVSETLDPAWAARLAARRTVFSTDPTPAQEPMPAAMRAKAEAAILEAGTQTGPITPGAPDGLLIISTPGPVMREGFQRRCSGLSFQARAWWRTGASAEIRDTLRADSGRRRPSPSTLPVLASRAPEEPLKAGPEAALWERARRGETLEPIDQARLLEGLKSGEDGLDRLFGPLAQSWAEGGQGALVIRIAEMALPTPTFQGQRWPDEMARLGYAEQAEAGAIALRPAYTVHLGPTYSRPALAAAAKEWNPAADQLWPQVFRLSLGAPDSDSFDIALNLLQSATGARLGALKTYGGWIAARAAAEAELKGMAGGLDLGAASPELRSALELELMLRRAPLMPLEPGAESRPNGSEPTWTFPQGLDSGVQLRITVRREPAAWLRFVLPGGGAGAPFPQSLSEYVQTLRAARIARAAGTYESESWGLQRIPNARWQAQISESELVIYEAARGGWGRRGEIVLGASPSDRWHGALDYQGPYREEVEKLLASGG